MPFLLPNQQRQSTEGTHVHSNHIESLSPLSGTTGWASTRKVKLHFKSSGELVLPIAHLRVAEREHSFGVAATTLLLFLHSTHNRLRPRQTARLSPRLSGRCTDATSGRSLRAQPHQSANDWLHLTGCWCGSSSQWTSWLHLTGGRYDPSSQWTDWFHLAYKTKQTSLPTYADKVAVPAFARCCSRNTHTHTHTHTLLMALFPGLPRWAGTER